VDVSIESATNLRAMEVFSCPQATTSVYSLRIHQQASLPPRVELVLFGQDKITVGVRAHGAKLLSPGVSGIG